MRLVTSPSDVAEYMVATGTQMAWCGRVRTWGLVVCATGPWTIHGVWGSR